MLIMRRFKTNSASSSTTTSSTSRKSSTVSGLFKSASSPTPPTDFRQNSSTSSGETGLQPAPQQPPVEKLSRSTALFRYGRAINRSLHSALGNNNTNSSNETSTSNETAESSCQIAGSASSNARLLTAGSNVTEFVPKSPVSPKMPSRFKFSKNKVKSNSGLWYSSANTTNTKSIEPIKPGASCPGLLETDTYKSEPKVPSNHNIDLSPIVVSGTTRSKLKNSNSSSSNSSSGSKPTRPLLIRQHSDEHQNALIEKAMQESSKSTSKKDKKSSSTTTTSSHRTLSNKNVGKLRKMGALECPVVPNDIVFEEGDNNKVLIPSN